jgi:large subunit ribosomal protein L16
VNSLHYGLKALNYGWINSIQLNSILRLIKIILKKKYKIKINSSLIFPITKKPLETRMGSGKAERKFWKCPIIKGMIIFEFGQISLDKIKYINKIIKNRLCFLVKIVKIVY